MARLKLEDVEFLREKEKNSEDTVLTRKEISRERKRKLKKSEKRKLQD